MQPLLGALLIGVGFIVGSLLALFAAALNIIRKQNDETWVQMLKRFWEDSADSTR